MRKKIILFFCFVTPLNVFSQNNETAELYYDSAYSILNSTINESLSKERSFQAISNSDKAILLNPYQSKYYRVRGGAYLHLKNYDQALYNFIQALNLDSTNSLALMGCGIAFENTNRFELAEKFYFKALRYDSTLSSVYVNLGLMYSKWNKLDFALIAYDRAIEISPNYASAYINRGDLKLKMQRFIDAIADFNIVIQLDSNSKIAYNNRGLCEFYLKNFKQAISDFEKALSIKLGKSFDENFDTDAYSLNNIANSYMSLGNIEKACEYWKLAIEKGYVYNTTWKSIYNIEDPILLIKKYCR